MHSGRNVSISINPARQYYLVTVPRRLRGVVHNLLEAAELHDLAAQLVDAEPQAQKDAAE